MRGASIPERRRAEFARLNEIDDAVDAFLDRDEFGEPAPDVRELVAVAIKALLGVVRRFEGHELTLELQWIPGTTVTIGYRDGTPSLTLAGGSPGSDPTHAGAPSPRAASAPPREPLESPLPAVGPPEAASDVVVPGPRRPPPPAGPATTWLPRREPRPVPEPPEPLTEPPDPVDRAEPAVEPPLPTRRALRDDVAAELAALREATRRRNGTPRDGDGR